MIQEHHMRSCICGQWDSPPTWVLVVGKDNTKHKSKHQEHMPLHVVSYVAHTIKCLTSACTFLAQMSEVATVTNVCTKTLDCQAVDPYCHKGCMNIQM